AAHLLAQLVGVVGRRGDPEVVAVPGRRRERWPTDDQPRSDDVAGVDRLAQPQRGILRRAAVADAHDAGGEDLLRRTRAPEHRPLAVAGLVRVERWPRPDHVAVPVDQPRHDDAVLGAAPVPSMSRPARNSVLIATPRSGARAYATSMPSSYSSGSARMPSAGSCANSSRTSKPRHPMGSSPRGGTRSGRPRQAARGIV